MSGRSILSGALLALSLTLPTTLPAQDLTADVREAASQRVWIRRYLRLYDHLLSMQAALGRITTAQADSQILAGGRELHEIGFHDEDMDAVRQELRTTAEEFLASLEYEIANSTTWPADLPAESYRSLSTKLLPQVRAEFERSLGRGADPVAALRDATLLLAFARGYDTLPPELDFFAGAAERAAWALPGIQLMPIDGPAPVLPIPVAAAPPHPANPPPIVTTPPRVNPVPPAVPARAGGAQPPVVVQTGGGRTPPVVILISFPPRRPPTAVPATPPLTGAPAPIRPTPPTVRPPTAGAPIVPTIPRQLPPPAVPPTVTRTPVTPPAVRPPATPTPATPTPVTPPVAMPVVPQTPATPPAAGAAPSRLSSFQVSWIGMDADVVTKAGEAKPDGSPDAHFRVQAAFSFWQNLTHLALYSSDASGNPSGGQMWHTGDARYWLLGVLYNDMNLNVRPVSSVGTFNGGVTLDLYAADSGWFTPGQTFVVEMGMGSTQAVAQVVQVGAAGAPPVTPPMTPPAVGGLTPGTTTTTWGTSPREHRGKNGQQFSYTCPPGGSAGSLWGTDFYTDDSSVCTAAVHAGLITFAGGGTVAVEIRAGQSSYQASERNGLRSTAYGAWDGSFVFVGAPTTPVVPPGIVPPPVVPPAVFAGSLQTDRDTYAEGQPITLTFSGFPGTNDWIAIAPAGAAAESYGEWKWTEQRTSGTLSFTAPAAGSYEARVFLDWPNGGYNVRAARAFTVGASAPTFTSLPTDFPAYWQWESDGGWTGAWTRRGASDLFDATYQGPSGQRVATVEELTRQADQIRGRRLSSSDGNLCELAGAIQPGGATLQGTGACPGINSGWGWRLTLATAPVTPPTTGVATPGTTTTTWGTNPGEHRGKNGQQFSYTCPPGGSAGSLWGTDIYTDDSSVCTAAVHAGLITFAGGGTVTVEIRAGQSSYEASERYGVRSTAYGGWSGSFVLAGAPTTPVVPPGVVPPPVVPPGIVPPPVFAGSLQTDRDTYPEGQPITVSFSGFPGTYDWIAIAVAGAAPESYGEWKWTDGSSTSGQPSGTPQQNGTLSFSPHAPGNYEVRAFLDWPNGGTLVRATHPFTVLAGGAAGGGACGRSIGSGVFDKWQSLGGEGGFLGCPTSDEIEAWPSPQGTSGRYVTFEASQGIIVWHGNGSRAGQAYEVHGDIVVLYNSMGGSSSWLGFPISDEYDAAGGRRTDFEGGYIHWTAGTRETQAYPYGQEPGVTPPPVITPPAVFTGQVYPDAQSYLEGQTITVTFTGFPGTNDWIALGVPGAPAEQYGEWYWTDGSATSGMPSGTPLQNGTLTFTAPAPGSYEVRAYANWPDGGHTIVASYPFTVEAGGVPRDLLVSYDAAWVGMDADVVSQGASATPDGAADGHFALVLDINAPYEVRRITIYSADPQGNSSGGQIWTTESSGYWALGVATQGSMLNSGHVGSLGTFEGRHQFDLYGASSGWFNDGQHFVVEADVGLAEPLRRLVVVSGGQAAPPGAQAGVIEQGAEGAIVINPTDPNPITTGALEAGVVYILEVSGTIGMWGDGNADRVDAVWCYNPPADWADRCSSAAWDVLRVDGYGFSDLSASAGGPSPLPFDPSHVYRVYIQGQGSPVLLSVRDDYPGDNSGAFYVRIYPAQ